MEEFLLRLLLTGNELDIVHQQQILALIFLAEFGGGAAADGLDQVVGEIHALYQHYTALGPQALGLPGDGVKQMGLAQSAVAIDEQRVEGAGWLLRHAAGGGVGHLVLRAHHIRLKGKRLAVGQRIGMIRPDPVIGGQLIVIQQLYLKIRGKDIPQRLLDLGREAFFNGALFEYVPTMQHQGRILHGDHGHLVEPGIDGGIGKLFFQPVKHCFPYIGQ